MNRLATHTAARTSRLSMRSSHADLRGLRREGSGWLHANIEHAVLTDMVGLEKSVCDRRATRPWALKRAIVIFSDHVQSMVEVLVLSGLRLFGAPVERINGSQQDRRGPHAALQRPTGAEGGGTRDVDAARGCALVQFPCASQRIKPSN
jgi:hypothetical protein